MNFTILTASACVMTMSITVSLTSAETISSDESRLSGLGEPRYAVPHAHKQKIFEEVANVDASASAQTTRPVSSRRVALESSLEGQKTLKTAREKLGVILDGVSSSQLVVLRLRAGLSQKAVCESTGIPQPHLSRLERGHVVMPDLSTLRKLARVLNVSVDEMSTAFDNKQKQIG